MPIYHLCSISCRQRNKRRRARYKNTQRCSTHIFTMNTHIFRQAYETSVKLQIRSGSVLIILTLSLTFDLSFPLLRLSASQSYGNSVQFHCHVSKMSNWCRGDKNEGNIVFQKKSWMLMFCITIRQRSKHAMQLLVKWAAKWCTLRYYHIWFLNFRTFLSAKLPNSNIFPGSVIWNERKQGQVMIGKIPGPLKNCFWLTKGGHT